MASVATHPPILLQQHPRVTPTFESLFKNVFDQDLSTPYATLTDDDTVSLLMRQYNGESDYNQYAFSQYVMTLYVKIFVSPQTSHIVQTVLQNTLNAIAAAYNDRRITDPTLGTLIRSYIDSPTTVVSPARGRLFIDALKAVYNRLNANTPGTMIKDVFMIVCAIYDDRPVNIGPVQLYETAVTDLDNYTEPTLRLIPTNRTVCMDTTKCATTPDLCWKFVYSLNIPQTITEPGDFIGSLFGLARMALPLDPIALTTTMRDNLTNNSKTGVPFLNYLAMYLRQKAMGTDYQLSRLADTRRILVLRMHKFCGVGATFIKDSNYIRPFLNTICHMVDEDNELNTLFSQDDLDAYEHLQQASRSVQTVSMTRKLRYTGSNEAADPKKATATSDADDGDKGAFADDSDPHDDTTQNDGDNIDSQADSEPESEPRPVSKFIPLALSTETIEDLLYRLSVLRFVSNLITTPDPKISNEAVSLLKTWCGSLLFIASSDTTRALITQLKLTGKLKEFK